jgi:hypothetical protein
VRAFARHVRPPPAVLLAWLIHLAISLMFGLILQANPELPESPWFFAPDWASNLAHWDLHWEARTVDQGYGADFVPQTSAKFPLAAMTARLLVQTTGVSIPAALFVVNKVGVLAGLWALWLLVDALYDRRAANRAVGYVAFSLLGTAYIYWMSYPDPLFLAQWALAFYWFYRGCYYQAGLVTTLAVWTRPQAALLIGVFALSVVVSQAKTRGLGRALRSPGLWRQGLAVCLPPTLGLAAWVIHISNITGISFSPYVAQAESGRADLMWPWQRLILRAGVMLQEWRTLPFGIWLEGWQLLLVLAGLIGIVVLVRRGTLRWELALFTLLSVFIPLTTRVMAIGRFATLTWIPLVLIGLIPARYRWLDGLLWAVGLALGLVVLVGINIFPLETIFVP